MPPVVDIHSHAMPIAVLEWLVSEGLADLSRVDRSASSGVVVIDQRISGVAAGVLLPLARSQWDVEARLAEMDAQGVDVHAVSLPPFLMASTCTDGDLVHEVVRRGNDALAELVALAPDRLVGLGTAPLGVDGVADEAARILDLGMSGVALGSRGAGREIDDPVNEDLWALLAARGSTAFLHPSGVPDLARISDYWLPQLLGYPMETAVAVARLVFSGVTERHDFPLVLAHGGGCLPSVRGRLDLGWERKEVARTTVEPPTAHLQRLYYDTAVFSPDVLADLVRAVGAQQVVMGTDFPFELADRDPRATVASLGMDADGLDLVSGATAARLLRLPDPSEEGS